jgi:hypothetical protein
LVTQEKILTLEGKLAYGGKKMLPNSVSWIWSPSMAKCLPGPDLYRSKHEICFLSFLCERVEKAKSERLLLQYIEHSRVAKQYNRVGV